MATKSTKRKTSKPTKQSTLGLRSRINFSLPTALAVVALLAVAGFFILKAFAAVPAAYPCNSPFPTIQSGTKDITGGRTDKCVTAIQQIFYVKAGQRDIVRNGVVDAVTLAGIKNFQALTKVAQTGVLSPAVVGGIPAFFGYSGYAVSTPVNPPCEQLGTCPKTCEQLGTCPKTCEQLGTCPKTCEELGTCPINCADTDSCPVDPPPIDNPEVSVESLPEVSDSVNLDDISNASPDELQKIIDDTTQASEDGSGSENVARSFSGRLRILPPQQDIDDGATEFKYYINAKLKSTTKKKPYAYIFDTTRVKNSRYILTIVSYSSGEKLYENSYIVTTKNTLNFWQKLYNFITAPFVK